MLNCSLATVLIHAVNAIVTDGLNRDRIEPLRPDNRGSFALK